MSNSQAAIAFDIDTVDDLTGTFSRSSVGSGSELQFSSTFPHNSIGGAGLGGVQVAEGSSVEVTVSGYDAGSGTFAIETFDTTGAPKTFADRQGEFTSLWDSVTPVYYRYSNLAISGGTFSGSFQYSTTPIPEPGTWALMAGLGLLGFAGCRKLRRRDG